MTHKFCKKCFSYRTCYEESILMNDIRGYVQVCFKERVKFKTKRVKLTFKRLDGTKVTFWGTKRI